MSTVVFKWNPSFSSFTMLDYLYSLYQINQNGESDFNWSVWDYDKIKEGDRYFWLKLGYGSVGIVSSGIITSDPYQGRDWSGKGRTTYYVDFVPDIMINPDTLPILSSTELTQTIPSFDWNKGHSGLVLEHSCAAQTEELWQTFLRRYDAYFKKAKENHPLDQIYLNQDDE